MNKYWVASTDEIPVGGRKIVTVNGIGFGIFNVNGEYRAYRNVCPHAGALVCVGDIRGTTLPSLVYEYKSGRDNEILRCPWHGWEFDLLTGEHLVDPNMKLRRGKLVETPCLNEHENLERGVLETEPNGIFLVI